MPFPEPRGGNEAAGFSRCSRWCNGRVAYCSARAADNAAGDRVSSQRIGFTLTGAVAVWPLAARAQQPDGMWPYRQSCARSFQFGRASAPMAADRADHARPEGGHRHAIGKTAHVQRCVVIAANRAAGDCQRAHAVFTHVAEGHHFTASLKKSLNMLTTRKMITSNNKMPAVIARMRNHFSRMLPAINPACTLRLLIFWWLRLVLAVSRCENALRRFYVRREEFLPPTAVARLGGT